MPNTQINSLRRGGGDTGGGRTAPRPAPQRPDGGAVGGPFGRTPTGQNPVVRTPPPPAAPAQPTEGWASEKSAKDVYGFLSDFTAGVQRGLDETKGDEPT
jgi:hypothetical protein